MDNTWFINEALKEARKSLKEGGIPLGAVLVKNGKIIGRGHSKNVQGKSLFLHEVIDCLENARRHKVNDFRRCTLYSTLSPCELCAGAILISKISKVVIGENVNFKGPETYLKKRGVEIVDVDHQNCKTMTSEFITKKTALWNENFKE